MARKIIIDCDPGVDDALAIFLALATPEEIEVLGITCVVGNVALDQTFVNARRILAAAGRVDLPVLRGAARPMLAPTDLFASVHGVDGLGDLGLPVPEGVTPDQGAVDFIRAQVRRYPGEVTLCPIGPMTNIALAMMIDPDLAGLVQGIHFMGGAAFCPGNMNDFAEFNFIIDPHAAQIVMRCGAPLEMYGLDVTMQAVVEGGHLAAMRQAGTGCAVLAADLLTAYAVGDQHLHDPCVIAGLIAPALFSGVQSRVSVVHEAGARFGQSVAVPEAGGNCRVITGVDRAGLFDLLIERLARLP